MTLPACAELSAHLTKMDDARDAVEAARRPVLELDDRSNAASAAQRTDEAELAAIRQAEADDIVACGRSGKPRDFSKDIARVVALIDRDKRVVEALEARRSEVERPLRDAELSLSVLASGTEPLIAAVVAAHADDLLAALADAREKAARAEAAVRTLGAHVVGRKWFSLGERIHTAVNKMPLPDWRTQPFGAWAEWTVKLAVDPKATPAVPK